jgi:hypothetical protein
MFSKSSLPPFLSPKKFSKINKEEKQSEKKREEKKTGPTGPCSYLRPCKATTLVPLLHFLAATPSPAPLSSVPRPLTLVVWYLADSQARLLVLVSRHQALKPTKLRSPAPSQVRPSPPWTSTPSAPTSASRARARKLPRHRQLRRVHCQPAPAVARLQALALPGVTAVPCSIVGRRAETLTVSSPPNAPAPP